MSTTATLKTGDTGRVLAATLSYADGDPINLTGCDVTFHMRPRLDTYASVSIEADIVSAAAGTVTVGGWAEGDIDEPGAYLAEFEITDSSETVVTVPSHGYLAVTISAAIRDEPPS